MDPINYAVDVKTPFEASMGGLTQGFALREQMAKAKATEQAQALQLQLQKDLAGLAGNKNAGGADYASMMVKYPQLAEHFKKGWDVLNADQQQNKISQATQVYAAVNSGRPEIAIQLLNEQATALRNSGKEDEAKAAETMAKFIEMDPKSAKTTTGLLLSSIMGPDKFADTFTKLEQEGRASAQAPADLSKKEQDARKAKADADLGEIKARYGEQHEVVSLAEKGWNIKKIEEDIKLGKVNSQIAAMNAQSNRMNATTNQGELKVKISELQQKRDDALRAKVSEVTSARANIDNLLNTVERIRKAPGLDQMISPTGPSMDRIPTMRQDTADLEGLIENLGAQAFLSQLPQMKGLGALSDAEGKKLTAALQNLSMKQSIPQLKENLDEVERLMTNARKSLVQKYGVPDSVPDTPAAAPSAARTDELLKKYGPKGASGTY